MNSLAKLGKAIRLPLQSHIPKSDAQIMEKSCATLQTLQKLQGNNKNLVNTHPKNAFFCFFRFGNLCVIFDVREAALAADSITTVPKSPKTIQEHPPSKVLLNKGPWVQPGAVPYAQPPRKGSCSCNQVGCYCSLQEDQNLGIQGSPRTRARHADGRNGEAPLDP